MNPEQNRRQCAACGEPEPLFTHTVHKNSGFRQLCTDCLLKEHRELFCPVCLNVFVDVPPPQARIICLNCPSITHLDCYRPPSSSAASSSSATPSFTCPPCSDPNFSFFSSKFRPPSSDQSGEINNDDGSESIVEYESATALIAAANIAAVNMNNAAAHLKKEAVRKILEAKLAKKRAKEAMVILHDLVLKQKASEKGNPNKRKASDR
ncbi:hypothetical protein EUTSA_v10022081mg [Eutrema salsugineum]|uniref:PHD-type domain-containing protein n=1 Tax=Eutrema salsugineum TaxID=72664 RepID=V4LWH6_EUTSA|nr:uncharacterized protein LOC18024471 [Eutrema salsugineum]ESQ48179.1 hypothetical protein EUTSA_v10022081mg [Eutrema salsugineum]